MFSERSFRKKIVRTLATGALVGVPLHANSAEPNSQEWAPSEPAPLELAQDPVPQPPQKNESAKDPAPYTVNVPVELAADPVSQGARSLEISGTVGRWNPEPTTPLSTSEEATSQKWTPSEPITLQLAEDPAPYIQEQLGLAQDATPHIPEKLELAEDPEDTTHDNQ